MFQYAMYLVLKKKHRFSFFCFDIRKTHKWHNGFELPKVFGLRTKVRIKFFHAILAYLTILLKHGTIFREIVEQKYTPEILSLDSKVAIYSGFWQTEKYFVSMQHIIRATFRFNEELLNAKTKELYSKLIREDYVSIHIRRGDYLLEPERHTFGDEYYRDAIKIVVSQVKSPKFVVFSDDKEYIRSKSLFKNALLVDWNIGDDSWQDMFLMSKCKHNIIANSSFSWWGAWLNANPNKIVIAPKIWIKGFYNEDIVPNSWIRCNI